MTPRRIHMPMLVPLHEWLVQPSATIAHAQLPLQGARRAAARAAGAGLGVRVFLPAAFLVLHPAAPARRDGGAGRGEPAAVDVHSNLRDHARAGPGVRLAVRALSARAAPAGGLPLLRVESR